VIEVSLKSILASIPAGDMMLGLQGGSSVGKSLIGTALAERLGAEFYDIGTVFRAMTAVAQIRCLNLGDEVACVAFARACEFEWRRSRLIMRHLGVPFVITKAVRSQWVSANVPRLANYPEVWAEGARMAREWIGEPESPVVVAGRHLPALYRMRLVLELTRDIEERLQFRRKQGGPAAAAVVLERDAIDARTAVCLDARGEVVQVDLTGQTKASQLRLVLEYAAKAGFSVL
jgi:cytidylate kinase